MCRRPAIGVERSPQRRTRSIQTGLVGAEWDVEHDGCFEIGQPKVVMDDQDGALVDAQTPEASLELIAHRGCVLDVLGHGRIHGRDPDLHDAATTRATRLPVAGVDEQPAKPSLKPIRFANRSNMEPSRQQRILNGVCSTVLVAKDQAGRPEELVERGRRELRERLAVAAPGSIDELWLHWAACLTAVG
jgi:hypothetical protein